MSLSYQRRLRLMREPAVAHIYDDRPEAASFLNLAALCQRCHNRHDMMARAAGRRDRIEAASGQLKLFTLNTRGLGTNHKNEGANNGQ